jgi:glutamyl-Q tRNA(Asp) synthetase
MTTQENRQDIRQISRPVLRFAPSPNGYLHLGHAYSALLNYKMAKEVGGRFLLRIEDIDLQRSKPEYEAAIFEDLAWLGIEWEEPVMRQSQRFADYELALDRLDSRGLVFPCFCSRGDIAAKVAELGIWQLDPDGQPLYPGTCKHLSEAERRSRLSSGRYAARRLDMTRALSNAEGQFGWNEYSENRELRTINAEPSLWGDAVIGRKDVPTSYHLAVVVDDAAQGITDIVRGLDLFNATSLHRLLQEWLDLPAPNYHHHHLLTDDDGHKLSKSLKAKSLRQLRAEGVTAADIRQRVGLGSAGF